MPTPPDDPAAIGRLRADYDLLVRRLETSDGQFRRLGRSVLRVQEEERRRIARELHDGIGQNLTALKHQLSLLAASTRDPALAAALDAGVDLCARTLADTRELSRLLRPQVLDDLGLAAALRGLARTVGEPAGVDVAVEIDDALPALDDERQTLVFRVAQEALTNVVRHAATRTASISLAARAGHLVLDVTDEGRGFDVAAATARASAGGSAGLGGMRDRVALHGGTLRIESTGAGTRVQAAIPVAARDDGATA